MTTKKKGGVKTVKGKLISSQNSTKHGLTTLRPSGSKEKEIVQAYIQELSLYYEPESPLEKLQIERIAICKAKLDRLYEVELVQLELATEKFTKNPDLVLDQIEHAVGVAKGMVKELIQDGVIHLPCSLTDDVLERICEEIDHVSANLSSENDLEIYCPHLVEYLKNYQPIGGKAPENLFEKLKLIADRIEKVFERGDGYHVKLNEYAQILMHLKEEAEKNQAPKDDAPDELDLYIQSRQKARDAEYPRAKKVKEKIPAEPELLIDQELLKKQINLFERLLEYRNKSWQIFEQYQSMRDLMIRGIVLPQADSDLLMRYQTTLDRRLSTAIGELLHLQSKK